MKTAEGNKTSNKYSYSTGWIPPLPDQRNYTIEHPEIDSIYEQNEAMRRLFARRPPRHIDLRRYFPPVRDQGGLNSCTAFAATAIVEYFQNVSYRKIILASPLFTYKTSRRLVGTIGDSGSSCKHAMASLAIIGASPEKYWQYTDNEEEFDLEPPAFNYAVADNYEALRYYRLDQDGSSGSSEELLKSIKTHLASKIPIMFGLPLFSCAEISWEDEKGRIPFPCPADLAKRGHAVVAVGYDDKMEIKNPRCDLVTKGAILIRNSWGTQWGEEGYGWLPYEYVLQGFAKEFWALISAEWLDTTEFEMLTEEL